MYLRITHSTLGTTKIICSFSSTDLSNAMATMVNTDPVMAIICPGKRRWGKSSRWSTVAALNAFLTLSQREVMM